MHTHLETAQWTPNLHKNPHVCLYLNSWGDGGIMCQLEAVTLESLIAKGTIKKFTHFCDEVFKTGVEKLLGFCHEN